MTRRLVAALVSAVTLLGAAPAAGAAAVRGVDPAGLDEGDCRDAPCLTWAYAYERSGDGDVIEIRPGVHGPQAVPPGEKRLTFAALPGSKVRTLHNRASNVTYDGVDVDAGFTTPNGAAFENRTEPGGMNVTFKNGRIGNVVDQKGALLGGSSGIAPLNLVLDNVEFHDVLQRTAGVHNECVFSETPGLTIRNSRFSNCATMDLFIVRGDWWGQPAYGGITLENNVFGHSVNGTGWHSYAVYFANGKFENIRAVHNTFEGPVAFENLGIGPYSGVWANNVGGGWECLNGVTYRGNVGGQCGTADKLVSPGFSCAPAACPAARTMPVGWVDPGAGDFHLTAASPARAAADPAYALPLDRDGKPRGAKPDSGAYQHDGDLSGVLCAPLDLGEIPKASATKTTALCAGRDLSFALSKAPAHGTATIDAAGVITYTAAEGYTGSDKITLLVWPPSGASTTAEITVRMVNHAPVCAPLDLGSVGRDSITPATMDCTDPDGDTLQYFLVTQPSSGQATINSAGRQLVYYAPSMFAGRVDFAYAAGDGTATSTPTAVTVNVANSAPVCQASSETIRTGKPWTALIDCADGDADPLEYSIADQPEHGTAEIVADDFGAGVVYRPAAGYTGGDRVTIRASDGLAQSEPAALAFDVTVNHAPACEAQLPQHTRVGAPASVRIRCTDEDRQDHEQLEFAVASSPAHGTLAGLPAGPAGEVIATYTPAAGFTGADAFVIHASDGDRTGMAATRIHVADTPYCGEPSPLALERGAAAELELTCTQPADAWGPLTYAVVVAPAKGSLSGSGPRFTYTAGDTGGSDSFAVTASGLSGVSPPVTQTIAIAHAAPTCAPQDLTVARDQWVDVPLTCVDPAGGDPALEIVTPPPATHGTLSAIDQAGHRVRFTPGAFTGETSFTFRAGAGAPATVRITVTPANQPPTATLATPAETYRGTPVQLTAEYSDPDGDGTIAEAAWDLDDDGSFDDGSGPAATVTFATLGPKTVRFRVTDNGGESATATKTIAVLNRAPAASVTGPATTHRGVAVEFTGAASDPDGDATVTKREWDIDGDGFDDGEGATVSVTFTSLGVKTVRFRATDDDSAEAVGSATIEVLNRAPAASVTGPATTHRGVAVEFTGAASDPDGDATVTKREWDIDGDGFDDGEGATVSVTFTSLGVKTVRFRATDDDSAEAVGSATIEVLNRAPAASVTGPATTHRGVAVEFTGAASDPDGDATVTKREWDIDGDGFDDGEGATTSVTFTSLGVKTVRFRATDDDGATAIGSTTIEVLNRAPSASIAGPAFTQRRVDTTFTGSGTDPDGQIATYEWDVDGDGFDDGSGLTVTTTFNSSGAALIKLRVTDDDGGTAVTEKIVIVHNAAPTAAITGPSETHRGVAVTLTGVAEDPDGNDTLDTIAWDTNGDGEFDDGDGPTLSLKFMTLGTETVSFRVTDDFGASETAEHTIEVTNRPPGASLTAPASSFVGDPVELTGAGSDADGNATITALEWDVDGDGFDDGSGATLRTTFPTTGVKTVRFRVTDDDSATAVAERSIDVVARAITPPAGNPPAAIAPPASPAPASTDAVAPTLTATARRQKLGAAAKGLKLTLVSSESCAVKLAVTVDAATARRLGLGRATTLATLTRNLPAGRSTLTLKFSSKVRRALSRSRRSVKLKIAFAGADGAGNTGTTTLPLALAK